MLRISKYILLTALLLVGTTPAWARPTLETLTPEETQLLQAIRAHAIEQAVKLSRETSSWGQCFKNETLCPPSYLTYRNSVRALIRIKNAEYRKAMAMANPAVVERGQVQVSLKALPFFAPTVTLTNDGPRSEYSQVLELMQADRDAMKEKMVRLKTTSNRTGAFGSTLPLDPKRSRFYGQAITLYELQVRNSLYEYPFLSFLDVADPTDDDLATAFTKLSEASATEIAKLKDLEQTPLSDFVHFYANAGAILDTHPEWKENYESLKSRLTGMGAAGRYFESKLNWIFLGLNTCTISALYFAPPVAFACGLASIPFASVKLNKSYIQYERDWIQWLMRQKTAEQLGESGQDMMFRAISLAFMVHGFASGLSTLAREGLTKAMTESSLAIQTAGPLSRVSASITKAEFNMLRFDARAFFVTFALTHRSGEVVKLNPAFMQTGAGAAAYYAARSIPLTFAQVTNLERALALPH